MESKLTLKLKATAIDKGKRYAKAKKTSLSKLVENYLEKIAATTEEEEISPLVKSLTGVAKNNKKDWKEEREGYIERLAKKYR